MSRVHRPVTCAIPLASAAAPCLVISALRSVRCCSFGRNPRPSDRVSTPASPISQLLISRHARLGIRMGWSSRPGGTLSMLWNEEVLTGPSCSLRQESLVSCVIESTSVCPRFLQEFRTLLEEDCGSQESATAVMCSSRKTWQEARQLISSEETTCKQEQRYSECFLGWWYVMGYCFVLLMGRGLHHGATTFGNIVCCRTKLIRFDPLFQFSAYSFIEATCLLCLVG